MSLLVRNLQFERNHLNLFQAIHCEIALGECLQIMGANGCGKTTLLRLLAAFIEPYSGEILWNGQSVFNIRTHYQQLLRYFGHKSGINKNLTVYENIQMFSLMQGNLASRQDIISLAEQCNLRPHLPLTSEKLSAGQLRRLAMVNLLIHPVPLWILDEPLSSLDQSGQDWVISLFNQHLERKGSLILATHQNLSNQLTTGRVQTFLLSSPSRGQLL